MSIKYDSPFTPGNPVPVEFFVGREKQIEEVRRYINQTLSGRQESIFLVGDRGIGKSSLATFLRDLAKKEEILGIHVFLGGVSTLEDMVQRIFDRLLKESKDQGWFKNIKHFFGKYIQEVGLLGVSISFSPPLQDLKELVRNFSDALINLIKELKKAGKKGLFIILDDINGLAETKEFADWYKSFVDEVSTHYNDFPVSLMLIGLPEKRERLSELQPSLMRIFRIIEIEKLSDNEVRDFLLKSFKKVTIDIDPKAMDFMVKYSSGWPVLMQEIGDATFLQDTDGTIDEWDATNGVINAAKRVGNKYLTPKVYKTIHSQRYKSILQILSSNRSSHFTKKDIESKLNHEEKKVFHNFLTKLSDLGVIEQDSEGSRGTYRFVNELYRICIWVEYVAKPKKKK